MDQANKLRDIIRQKNQQEKLEGKMGFRDEICSHSISQIPVLNSRVITVTSGKGGVGKTNFTLNLAIQMRKQNKRVVIIDADFGLANIEVLFGVVPRYSFADVLLKNKPMKEVLTDGPLGIQFISGGSGFSSLANITEGQMEYILKNFDFLDTIADVVLIDTGAGISKSVINFIKASKETIIITTPEPTSITDAYAIIKSVKEEGKEVPSFKIIVNRVDDGREGEEIFKKLEKVSEKFLNIKLENLGWIPYDNNLVKAVKRQEPVSLCFPDSPSSKRIEEIGNKLLNVSATSEVKEGIRSFMKKLVNIFGN